MNRIIASLTLKLPITYKFELGDFKADAAQRLTADVQIVLVLLLCLARQRQFVTSPDAVRTAEAELDSAMATTCLRWRRIYLPALRRPR